MNERIKELMLEAGYAAPEIAGRANKLSELIVKECIDVIINVQPGYKDYRNQIEDAFKRDAIEIIQQHFGVD